MLFWFSGAGCKQKINDKSEAGLSEDRAAETIKALRGLAPLATRTMRDGASCEIDTFGKHYRWK